MIDNRGEKVSFPVPIATTSKSNSLFSNLRPVGVMSVPYYTDEERSSIDAADSCKEKPVLIVDESRTGRMVATDLVARAGFQTCSLGDSPDVVQIAESVRPILIILASKISSTDLLKQIGALSHKNGTCFIPIIVTLTKDSLPQTSHLLAAGAVDCICKPLCPDEFVARVKVAVRNSLKIRLALEQRQQEFAHLASCLTDKAFEPVIVCDDHGCIEAWSTAADSLFGNLPNMANGLNISSFIPQIQTILDATHSAQSSGDCRQLTATSSLVFEATLSDGSRILLSIARLDFQGLQRIIVFAKNKCEGNSDSSQQSNAALEDAYTRAKQLERLVKSELQLPLQKIAGITADELKGIVPADRQSIFGTIRICMAAFRNLLAAVDTNDSPDSTQMPQLEGFRFDTATPNNDNKPHITDKSLKPKTQRV